MCACSDPEGEFLRPAFHEEACPVFVFKCSECAGKGYVFRKPPAANMPVGTWNYPICDGSGSEDMGEI